MNDFIDTVVKQAAEAEPLPPPIEIMVHACRLDIGTVTLPTGHQIDAIILTHVSGGARFVVPVNEEWKRVIAAAFGGKPLIHVPPSI